MDQKNLADKLQAPTRPWRTALIVLAGALVAIVAIAISGVVFAPDTGRPEAVHVHLAGSDGKPTAPQMTHKLILTTHVAKSEEPPPPPPPVYVAPPAQSYSYGNYPSGWVVPFLPGTNAPDTSACASGSASTINGTPRCD